MGIREISGKAENLIEQGEQIKSKKQYYEREVINAQREVMETSAKLESASQRDEQGEPVGDVHYAKTLFVEAQIKLDAINQKISESTESTANLDKEKLNIIQNIDTYTTGEKQNLAKVKELQKIRFGGNVNAFIADLAERMSQGEEAKLKLIRSMGSEPPTNVHAVVSDARELSRMVDEAMQKKDNESEKPKVYTREGRKQTLADKKELIRKNWMNHFNADKWKAILTEKSYMERIELYRRGLEYEIGKDAAQRLTVPEIEDISRQRRGECENAFEDVDVKKKWEETSEEQTAYNRPTATNSFQRAEEEQLEIPCVSRLSDKAMERFPQKSQQAIHNAFAPAPTYITDITNEEIPHLVCVKRAEYLRKEDGSFELNEKGQRIKQTCHYSPKFRHIVMDMDIKVTEFADILQHEMGHFIDHMKGSISDTFEFSGAVKKDKKRFDASTDEGRMNLKDLLDDAFSSGAAYDRNITDIISALTTNDTIVLDSFRKEGVANYQHKDEYWELSRNGKSEGMREKEVFANIFGIESANYSRSVNFVERWFPETCEVFRSKVKGE